MPTPYDTYCRQADKRHYLLNYIVIHFQYNLDIAITSQTLMPAQCVSYSPVANIGDTWCSEERTHKRGSFLYFVELRFDLF